MLHGTTSNRSVQLILEREHTWPRPSTYVDEIDEITKVMQAYIDGARTGKGAAMKPAFHDDATIFGYVGPELFAGPIQGTDFFNLVKIDGRWKVVSKVFYLHP
jgi:hypothetical protein